MKTIFLSIDTGAWDTAFGEIGAAVKELARSILGQIVVPIGLAICLVILTIQIIGMVSLRNRGHGNEIPEKIPMLIVVIVVTILLSSITMWAYGLFGF